MAAGGVYAGDSGSPAGENGADVPDLVVVGAASRDIAADDRRGWRLGGAATYCTLAAARLGVRVGCLVGVDEIALHAAELDLLRAAGADVRPVRLAHGPVFENIERDGHREQRWLSPSDALDPGELPVEWATVPAWLFGPVAGEVGEAWAGVPAPGSRVAVGWQGFLREFRDDGRVVRTPPRRDAVVGAADVVVASVDDLAAESSLAAVAGLLGPDATFVLTAGPRGGLVFRAGVTRRYPAVEALAAVDPTGAGDVFLAALMAAWLRRGTPPYTAAALRLAAAAASCAVEGWGLLAVPTAAEVARRLRAGQ